MPLVIALSASNPTAMSDSSKVSAALVAQASSWCASHGVLMGARDPNTRVPLGDMIYEPAPFSLFPTDFSKTAFDKAYSMGKPFNHVVHAAAQSKWLLEDAIVTAAQADPDFTGRMVSLAKQVLAKGRTQKVVLGILRSDYMLHIADTPLQVELNTIASSFGCLSSKVSKMHQELHQRVGEDGSLPLNNADDGIAKGLALALQEYQRQFPSSNAVVVMVVQPGETNSCDQRDLEFLLNAKYGVQLVRRTLTELAECATNDDQELILGNDLTAGVVYYRAGYTPVDYPTETEWNGRTIVEHSTAIKCPDVFYHTFGAKKVQQALATPGTLEKFTRSKDESDLLESCFAGLFALGEGDDQSVVEMALADPHAFVLKPQREGGGNNLYDDELVEALKTMSYEERGGFILMQKILPPTSSGSLVRRGKVVYDGSCICELGVFGVSLREYDSDRILMDDVVGHILRTKPLDVDEGGVAAGYAFLSSPKLI
jgi:glutathione synthase